MKLKVTWVITDQYPISVLSNSLKIFENIIKMRLIAFLEIKLSKNRYSFRPDLNTENTL